ncbi:MAG: family 43 glycosylhydrolase [Actinomycetota bacterium]|nr:family 43 glycosylhydrolase [Actinomycetota bacterium]
MELFPGVDPYVGAQIAGYKLEALVGRGGMSVVYRAQHKHLDRKVALKLLAPELSQDERFRKRFVRESRLAASLEHPNIIPIYDAGEAQGLLYIAMRFVEGCTLGEFLERRGPLLSPVMLYVIDQIAEALDVAHSAGLVHRDVKPENVLVTEDHGELEHVYLSDFGLTKRPNIDGTTKSGELMGTVGYVAPEQIEGKPLDGRADIYSLGCVLYQCLTGCRPFDLDSDVAILWAHLNQPPPRVTDRRSELPRAMNEVVAKAMAKTPEQRYGTARALAMATRSALGTEELASQPITRVGRIQTASRQSVALSGLLAIAVVGIALLVVRQFVAPSSAPPDRAGDSKPLAPSGRGLGQPLPTDPMNRSPTSRNYKNPLVAYNAPDPTIIAAGKLFYAYTTQTAYDRQVHIPILASRDLIDWRFAGDALKKLPPWAAGPHSDTWAPDILHIDGHYNIYFAERLKATGSMGIAVGTSDSPAGPFHLVGGPLMQARGYIDIDPFVLRDSSGRLLMYWGSDGAPIRVRQLSSDGTALVGASRPVLARSSATSYDGLVEGASVVHHGGFYFLFYSGDRCCGTDAHYAVLVARSRSAMGPFERATTNPIIAANHYFNAPGHGTVFRDGSGAYFILYHAMERSDPNHLRFLMLDRIQWQNGWPVVNGGNGPSHAPQPRPVVGT